MRPRCRRSSPGPKRCGCGHSEPLRSTSSLPHRSLPHRSLSRPVCDQRRLASCSVRCSAMMSARVRLHAVARRPQSRNERSARFLGRFVRGLGWVRSSFGAMGGGAARTRGSIAAVGVDRGVLPLLSHGSARWKGPYENATRTRAAASREASFVPTHQDERGRRLMRRTSSSPNRRRAGPHCRT